MLNCVFFDSFLKCKWFYKEVFIVQNPHSTKSRGILVCYIRHLTEKCNFELFLNAKNFQSIAFWMIHYNFNWSEIYLAFIQTFCSLLLLARIKILITWFFQPWRCYRTAVTAWLKLIGFKVIWNATCVTEFSFFEWSTYDSSRVVFINSRLHLFIPFTCICLRVATSYSHSASKI